MATGRLPDEGPVQIGSVRLPAGVHVVSSYGTAEQPAAVLCIKPGQQPRLIYRVHHARQRRNDQRKGFAETDCAA